MQVTGKRCWVSGLVQGVWFRDTTRRKALELGLSGHAINLADGRVEVLACGSAEAVEALCEWLWIGSEQSSVSDVRCETVVADKLSGFTIG